MTTLIQRETGYLFDSLLELASGGLVATTTEHTAIDLGAEGAGDNEDGVAVFRGDAVIDISAIEIASNDELYEFVIEGGDSLAFTTGDEDELARIHVGALEVLSTDTTVDSDVGRYILPFTNLRNTRAYRFIRLNVQISGTIATGINYTCFIGKPKV